MDKPKTPLDEACEIVGSQAKLARLIGVTPAQLNQWMAEKRPIPDDKAVAIEFEVEGRVEVERLCPAFTWVRVKDKTWPHSGGRPLRDLAAAKV